jgi:hypothetical protein
MAADRVGRLGSSPARRGVVRAFSMRPEDRRAATRASGEGIRSGPRDSFCLPFEELPRRAPPRGEFSAPSGLAITCARLAVSKSSSKMCAESSGAIPQEGHSSI